jgi:hypothetical protein
MDKIQQSHIKKYCSILCGIICLLLIALVSWREKLFLDTPPYYWMTGIMLVVFFYEFNSIIMITKKTRTASPKQIVSLYMLLKGVKIFLFLAALIVYTLVVKVETKRFVLVAVAIYFIFLLFDTFFLISTEKRMKK